MIGFDANVLVYAVDARDPDRQGLASAVVGATLGSGTALFPLQALAEFQSVSVRKLGLAPPMAVNAVELWSAAGRVECYTLADLRLAATAQEAHRLSLWDALIWAVCERAGARVLVTEDFQDGRTLGQVTFLDPFNPANAARLGLGSPS